MGSFLGSSRVLLLIQRPPRCILCDKWGHLDKECSVGKHDEHRTILKHEELEIDSAVETVAKKAGGLDYVVIDSTIET